MDAALQLPALSFDVVKTLVSILTTYASVEVLFRRKKRAKLDGSGWKFLNPSWHINFWLVGFGLCATVMWFLYFFVGSERPDAEKQELAMLLIALFLSGSTLLVYFLCYFKNFSWREGVFSVSRPGKTRFFDLNNVVALKFVAWRMEFLIKFSDGSRFYIPSYFDGVDEFMADLEKLDQ